MNGISQFDIQQFARIGEVFLGVRNCRVDPLERFIENGDDVLLFGKIRKTDFDRLVGVAV